jgi:hypothetical protein
MMVRTLPLLALVVRMYQYYDDTNEAIDLVYYVFQQPYCLPTAVTLRVTTKSKKTEMLRGNYIRYCFCKR